MAIQPVTGRTTRTSSTATATPLQVSSSRSPRAQATPKSSSRTMVRICSTWPMNEWSTSWYSWSRSCVRMTTAAANTARKPYPCNASAAP